MNQAAAIRKDWKFALDSGEFPGSLTKALRYVAAINPQVSRREFVEALKPAGVHPDTATKQFALSRKFDVASGGVRVDTEGRMYEGEGK